MTTDTSINPASALMAAALLLASVAEPAAAAQPPEDALLSVRYLDYRDYSQEGDRIRVKSPMVWLMIPIGERNALEASTVWDTVSGASAEFHNTLSGASGQGIADRRVATQLKWHHYFDRAAVSVSVSSSNEDDYDSRAVGFEAQWSTPSQNTTLHFGVGRSLDRINPEERDFIDQKRQSNDWLLGITQVLSPLSIIQSNLTLKQGHGYFDDPYKALDQRPGARHELAWLNRYNHYFPEQNAALNLAYRFYRDNWRIRAHTLDVAWHQNLAGGWALKPSLRYYSQTAAYFFNDRFPPAQFGGLYSADHRLGNFGAVTLGLKVIKQLGEQTTVDIGVQRYEQRSSWSLNGQGSPSLEPLKARSISLGLQHRF